MTRFLLSRDDVVDAILAALSTGHDGDTYVPRAPSARVVDIAVALVGDLPVQMKVTGIRPGEKIHERMVSEEEAHRTVECGKWYAVRPMLPVLGGEAPQGLHEEYSSTRDAMTLEQTRQLLVNRYLMLRDTIDARGEVLR